jgi:iron complex outermembrane receptor protein
LNRTLLFSSGLLTCLPILFSSQTLANDYQAEADFFGEAPVVLTVSRMHKPLAESPASVTVIDRQMIRNSGARQIADLFRMVPGFVVGYLKGHLAVVTYHGFGQEFSRQLQVLIDGRSVFIPSFGGVPWSNLPVLMQDIERIEIIRGPSSVTYGANAFLASINIITRQAAEDLGGEVSLTHDLDSDNTTQDIYLRYGNQVGDFDWRISAGREKDEGYATRNDDKTTEKLNIRTDFLTSNNEFWSIQAGINQSYFGLGKKGQIEDPIRDEDSINQYLNIKWEQIQDTTQSNIKFTYTNQDVNDRYTVIDPLYSSEVSFDRESKRTDLEIYQTRLLTSNLSWNYGLSMRQDEVNSFLLFHTNDNFFINTNNLFSSIEWKPNDSITIDFGGLVEDTNFTGTEDSFRLSIIKKLGSHHARFVSSSAIRNPILWELSGDTSFDATIDPSAPAPYDVFAGLTVPFEINWLNSGNLKPETIVSNEIGLFSEYLDRQLTTDIKLFQYEIKDQLASATLPLVPPTLSGDDDYNTIINGGKSRVEGLEIGFNYSPVHRNFRLYGGLSFLDSRSFEQDLASSIPDNTLYVGGHYQITQSQQVSAAIYSVDELSWADRKDDLESYTRLDIRYQYTLDVKNQVYLELVGQNLTDEYSDYRIGDIHEQSILMRISGRF